MKGAKRVQVLVAVFLPPLLLSVAFLFRFLYASPAMPELPAGPYPGDNIIPDAVMIYDQLQKVKAPPSDVWPWVMQVGKGRAGMLTMSPVHAPFRLTPHPTLRLVLTFKLGEISPQEFSRQSKHQSRMAKSKTGRQSGRLRLQRR